MPQKRIHFIGICGVAMSALALAFKKLNWKVTGSDVGFYPPVSTHLKDAGVDYYPGWHPDKMVANGVPDIVVVGNVAGSHNPEWLYVQEHKINYKSYPEIIRDYFIKQNSVVVAGTYGKSTSTAILTWILQEAGYNPSHMFGGVMVDVTPPLRAEPTGRAYPPLKRGGTTDAAPLTTPPFKEGAGGGQLPSAAMSASNWSVLEGDEYKASRWDGGPKFSYYSPTHLLLTSVVWDHADVYPTEASYIEAFKKLFNGVPANGVRVVSEKALPVIAPGGSHPPAAFEAAGPLEGAFVTYGKTAGCDYAYTNVKQTKEGVTFDVLYKNERFHLATSCLGEYMADNITGCFAMAHQIGVDPNRIITAVASFKGVKRRLEKRYTNHVTIFDDIAHSPSKAQAVLASLRAVYEKNIYAIFEPNTGNREQASAPGYAHAFVPATEVIIPRLTKLKISGLDSENKGIATPVPAIGGRRARNDIPMEGDELAKVIAATHDNVTYHDDDAELINYITKKIQPGDVVVFLGSHGFRGMIEALVEQLKQRKQ